MIYEEGNHRILTKDRKAIVEVADESFCRTAPDTVVVPEFEGWERVPGTLTALKLKAVEPHVDPWVGDSPEPDGDDRRAVFMVVKGPKQGYVHLQAGLDATRMSEGDFVLFDDRVMHSVVATHTWVGIAWQLRRKSFADQWRKENPSKAAVYEDDVELETI